MTPIVERRLRAALAVRADQITAADLQPAAPPSLLAREQREQAARAWRGRRSGGHRRTLSQRLGFGGRWLPVLTGVTVAAVAVVFAVLVMWPPREAGPPGRAPYLPGNAPVSTPATTAPAPVTEPPTRSSGRSGPPPANPTTRSDAATSRSAAPPEGRTVTAPTPTASTPGGSSSPGATRGDPTVRSTVMTG
jgi:hypothetical protein